MRALRFFILVIFLMMPTLALASPSIYPTGTTIYKPEKCWSGFNLVGPSWWGKQHSTYLTDMNGNVVKIWDKLIGHSAKMLPGGYVTGQYGERKKGILHQLDFDGNVVWKYDGAYANHDVQREGNPAGYYAPGMEPKVKGGKTLFLSHQGALDRPNIMSKPVHGNSFIEVDWDGKVLWKWEISDHFDELGLNQAAKDAIAEYWRTDTWFNERGLGSVDWAHINAMAWVGPNKWYDAGDERFHPENIIWNSRNMSVIAITDRKTGKIVWRIGPDWDSDPRLRKMGPIIGSHGVHIIPKTLPGGGNILVFDNGGHSVYGPPVPGVPNGISIVRRHYSRILEINPVTLEVIWEYSATKAKQGTSYNANVFFSSHQSNVQRLPNGNTFITEAAYGRLFEVTQKMETVWEFIDPFWREPGDYNVVFRAYRVPYEWVPQLKKPVEKAVTPPVLRNFRLEAQGSEAAKPVLVK
jgi:hypothetical protein